MHNDFRYSDVSGQPRHERRVHGQRYENEILELLGFRSLGVVRKELLLGRARLSTLVFRLYGSEDLFTYAHYDSRRAGFSFVTFFADGPVVVSHGLRSGERDGTLYTSRDHPRLSVREVLSRHLDEVGRRTLSGSIPVYDIGLEAFVKELGPRWHRLQQAAQPRRLSPAVYAAALLTPLLVLLMAALQGHGVPRIAGAPTPIQGVLALLQIVAALTPVLLLYEARARIRREAGRMRRLLGPGMALDPLKG